MTIADLNMNDMCCVTYMAPHRLIPHPVYVGTVVRLGKAGGGPIRPGHCSDSDDNYVTIQLNNDTFRSFSQSKVINISLWE